MRKICTLCSIVSVNIVVFRKNGRLYVVWVHRCVQVFIGGRGGGVYGYACSFISSGWEGTMGDKFGLFLLPIRGANSHLHMYMSMLGCAQDAVAPMLESVMLRNPSTEVSLLYLRTVVGCT